MSKDAAEPWFPRKTYYEVEAIVHAKRNGNARDITIIDVRDPDEREAEGYIPYSINIPAHLLKETLKLSGPAFQKKYGVVKPGKKDIIILYCRTGQRASFSMNYLYNEKYQRAGMLNGGHEEWAKNQKMAEDADL